MSRDSYPYANDPANPITEDGDDLICTVSKEGPPNPLIPAAYVGRRMKELEQQVLLITAQRDDAWRRLANIRQAVELP